MVAKQLVNKNRDAVGTRCVKEVVGRLQWRKIG